MGGRGLIAGDGAAEDAAPDGTPRVAPRSVHGMARLLQAATRERWRVRVEHDAWSPLDAPADLAVSTRLFDAVRDPSPANQVVTVGAGAPIEAVGLQAPGTGRTVGSALAVGADRVRDEVLGLTAVTGDGRILTVGGRVLKNVAGYDLAKLFIGGFDAFGVIVEAHLRLRDRRPLHDNPTGSVVLSVGALRTQHDLAITLLAAELPPHQTLTTQDGVRWSGTADAAALRRARAACARHHMPLTLERAPWAVRSTVGVHGSFRDGVAPLVDGLRRSFDPAGVFVV